MILIYLSALGYALSIGSMVFFASIFAPTVFKVLEKPQAATLQGEIFPKYFIFLIIATVLAGVFQLFYMQKTKKALRKTDYVSLTLLSITGAIFWLGYSWLSPEISKLYPLLYNPAQPASLEVLERFQFLHKFSVRSHVCALLALCVSFFISIKYWLRSK